MTVGVVVNTDLVTSTITDPVPELWLVDLVPIQYSLAVSGAVVMLGVGPLYILVKAVKKGISLLRGSQEEKENLLKEHSSLI